MADLSTTFAGIRSPNPFWLASAPPTDKEYNVQRAFEAGWGGVVWKTLGEAGPPIVNVNGPRYAALYSQDRRLIGFNNIELITDRPLDVNLDEIARTPARARLPISGIGGITTWKDAAEFIALGAGNVQVCTAAMTYGFKIVQDMCSGLAEYMDGKGFHNIDAFRGRAVPSIVDWNQLNLNHIEKARIDQDLCIQCGRCHVVCEDTSHQAISATLNGRRHFEVIDAECVGCNLCVSVCPVPACITMHALQPGQTDPRTGQWVSGEYANWTTHPNNPARVA
jgi:dihydropyrimidine dehydrogenase (NAD+) subunit PreA